MAKPAFLPIKIAELAFIHCLPKFKGYLVFFKRRLRLGVMFQRGD
jgi:hypothetical protein